MAKVAHQSPAGDVQALMRAQWQHLYSTAAWKSLRSAQLSNEPLCRMCEQMGRTTLATVADHIKPHKGDLGLFHDSANLQSLCKACHDGPKAREEARGFAIGCDVNGIPLDKDHAWNK